MPPSEACQRLGTSERGISDHEAQRRLETYGRNELPGQAFSRVQMLLSQFKNPIFVILIACTVITYLFLVDAGKVFFYRVCNF